MRLGARLAILSLALSAGAAACNTITGAKERQLDPEIGAIDDPDTGPVDEDDSGPVVLDATPPDAVLDGPTPDVDAGPLVIPVNVGGSWLSINGATFSTVDGGKRIDTATAAGHHPMIVPNPQPSIPSDNFTVHAVIKAATTGTPGPPHEFGILARIQSNNASLVVGGVYAQTAKPYVGAFGTDNNPSNPVNGDPYTYVAGARYRFKMSVTGNQVYGKVWNAIDPEPSATMIWGAAPYQTGRTVGFYTYNVTNAVLESMYITVP